MSQITMFELRTWVQLRQLYRGYFLWETKVSYSADLRTITAAAWWNQLIPDYGYIADAEMLRLDVVSQGV